MLIAVVVKIRPRKACNYPSLRSFGWVSYDKVGGLCYSGKLGSRSETRASDLRSYWGLWWNGIEIRLYEEFESEYSPWTCSVGRSAGGTLCGPTYTFTCGVDGRTEKNNIGDTCLRSQELSGALVEWNKATYLRRKRNCVISEDLLNWQTCRGHSVSPTLEFHMWRRRQDRKKGGFSHDFSLVLAPVSPSISRRARLAIVPFLWLVYRRAFPAPPRHTGGMRQVLEPFLPPRHAGGMRQVFDG